MRLIRIYYYYYYYYYPGRLVETLLQKLLFMKVSSKFKKPLLGSRLFTRHYSLKNGLLQLAVNIKWIMDLNNNKSDQPLWSKAYTLQIHQK